MSRQIAMDAICLRPTPRIAHTEYVDHHALIRDVTGRREAGAPSAAARREFLDAWEYDMIWSTDDGPAPWGQRGRVTDMGHAEYMEGGSDRRDTVSCPFGDAREVLEFDAVREYGLPDFGELVRHYRESWAKHQAAHPNQLVTGGYYKTIMSGAIQAFGWDMLLQAAADPAGFARVLDSFGRLTLHHVRAWAETPIEVFIQHDDFVWTQGPFLAPAFYRQVIIPLYKRLWDVLHAAGKKVLFCSDGTFDMFMGDVARAGADGFIFEPSNDFAGVVARFGRSHCLVGSAVDCRTMTFGTWNQVQAEMERTLALAPRCSGLVWAVGNHIPHNIPIELLNRYMSHLRAHWRRDVCDTPAARVAAA